MGSRYNPLTLAGCAMAALCVMMVLYQGIVYYKRVHRVPGNYYQIDRDTGKIISSGGRPGFDKWKAYTDYYLLAQMTPAERQVVLDDPNNPYAEIFQRAGITSKEASGFFFDNENDRDTAEMSAM